MKSLSDCPYEVGDLVDFKAKHKEEGFTRLTRKEGQLTRIIKSGQTELVSPTMVVVEIVKENTKNARLFDEKTGQKLRDPIKVRCLWYSFKQSKFLDRWFNIGALVRLPKENNLNGEKPKGEINEVVTLRTYLGSFKELELKYDSSPMQDEEATVSTSVTQVFSNLSFLPPKMLITAIEDLESKSPLYDKVTNELIRKVGQKQAKCMWYDPKAGKYSEMFFPLESLISTESLPTVNDIVDLP